ncbi:LLM class flavin-dependent oxidoreductase [Streptomyces eurythermus]
MRMGVNVPNFGPGVSPENLARWAMTSEGLGFDLLMLSDHVAITSDVARQYPAPFYEPVTTLAWLAGMTTRIGLGTTVLIAPYRHPLLVARMAGNLQQLSGGRLVVGVGVGWAREEFAALGVPFERRGALTDELLRTLRVEWENEADYGSGRIPVWVGGNSDAAIRRAVRFGCPWHPLRFTMSWFREALPRVRGIVDGFGGPALELAPRIYLQLTEKPVDDPDRRAGVGTLEQVLEDLEELRRAGSKTVVLDPYLGDPSETLRPEEAWEALAVLAAHRP